MAFAELVVEDHGEDVVSRVKHTTPVYVHTCELYTRFCHFVNLTYFDSIIKFIKKDNTGVLGFWGFGVFLVFSLKTRRGRPR